MSATPVTTRWAQVQPGDSLRQIALRELGDALRWIELANINQLRPPYIIESIDPIARQRAALLWGDRIAIPLGRASAAVQIAEDVLGRDVALPQGRLAANEQGDWLTLAADANFGQALAHRLKTPTGDLLAHPAYGCDSHVLLGLRNRQAMQYLLIGRVRQAIAQEPRAARTETIKIAALGDQVRLSATVTPVGSNSATDLNLVFPLG